MKISTMKTRINEVTIAEPCLQNWDEMDKGEGFNFCKACRKNVIDFSGYTNAEIISVLAGASSSVCGRLSQAQLNQLNHHLSVVPTTNRNWMKYLGVLAIGVIVFTHNASAVPIKKNVEIVHTKDVPQLNKADVPTILRTFYGYMFLRNNKVPMVGLKLRLKGTDITAITDKNGRYEFKIDNKLNWKYNELIADDGKYVVSFKLNEKTVKQKDYYPYSAEDTILGKIAVSFK
jgi:hypothetical protein